MPSFWRWYGVDIANESVWLLGFSGSVEPQLAQVSRQLILDVVFWAGEVGDDHL